MKYLPLFAVFLFLISCNEKENTSTDDTFDRKQMLKDYAEFYIIPEFSQLNDNVIELQSIANSIESNQDEEKINSLKSKFIDTYKKWQKVGFLNFGPSETNSLLNIINIFPANKNKILANIQSGNYNLLNAANIDAIGFPAIDYLLFSDDPALNSKFDDEKYKKYLLDLINLIKDRVKNNYDEWSGNYRNTFSENDGKSVGSSLSMIVNSINKYWEKDIRDGKLGIPIGIRTSGVVQKERCEAYYSKNSVELLKISVQSYINFFQNNEKGLSLYDYLYSRRSKYGDGTLHDKILNNFKNILSELNKIDGDLESNIDNNKDELISLYQEFQKQIVYLKVDMPAILGVSITYQDNDGD